MSVHAIPVRLAGSYIFLDVDGVLSPVVKSGDDAGMRFEACNVLRRVIQKTGCMVVVSGQWRFGGHGADSVFGQCLRATLGKFQANDVLKAVCGALPLVDSSKSDLISDWVSSFKPDRFAVVDDQDIEVPNLVRTDGRKGLTDGDGLRIIDLLGVS